MFATVTVSFVDLPSRTSPKGTRRSSIGATESVTLILPTAAAAPVPLTDTVTDAELGSSLGMFKLSVKVPVAVGAKATVIVQDAVNRFAEPTAPTARAAFPLFVTVTVWVTDEPAAMVPNGTRRSFVGATESVTVIFGTGTVPPVPLMFMMTELFAGSLLGILKLSVKVPAEAGAKATVRVQDADGKTVWFEQVSVFMEKGAASGFVEPTEPTTRLAVPVFFTVTV